MHVGGLSLPLVFLAGVVSFISPCVLPLVPGYLSVISGGAVTSRGGSERRVVPATLLFLAGFLLMFIALGASASLIGSALRAHLIWLNRGAGVLIVVFGLSMLGIGWSGSFGAGWQHAVQTAARRGGPIVLGVAFAIAWTPCVGPILGTILGLAAESAHLQTGAFLLLVYGLGLALPFLAVALGFGRFLGFFRFLQRHYRIVEITGGLLLVAMGVLLLTSRLGVINSYVQRGLSAVGLDWWSHL
jgi:cytochrome c-type biogenesis protein